ncbi:MAG: threonylcarbamoyl-AMP synthase [Cyclobacteriaceae bacterium]|nr:threonylcarbamoyl-AMP synthase [Cyclobacteriaceae bacterium]
MAVIGKDIFVAKELLEKGQLVAIPTETVYGLAANSLNARAVARIFEVKKRPFFDPLILHLPCYSKIENYVEYIPEKAKMLAEAFWPGPLTMIFKKKEIIPDLVTSGLDTVAIRVPKHPLTLELLNQLDFPLAAPSANPFGYISPTQALHVEAKLGTAIDYILDGGPCEVGIESTIVGFYEEKIVVHRLGGLSVESINNCIGEVEVMKESVSNPVAPGMLKSHYAPKARVMLGNIEDQLGKYQSAKTGILSFRKNYNTEGKFQQVILSETGDMEEAATRLFSGLRQLDSLHLQYILAEFVPDQGLGRAINDRLRRASAIENDF